MEKTFLINGTEFKVKDYKMEGDVLSFILNDTRYSFNLLSRENGELIIEGKERFRANVGALNKDGESIIVAGEREGIVSLSGKRMKKSKGHDGGLTSPMPGKIFKVLKEKGAEVKKGETILILEAMKMEHAIRADKDGKIKKINFQTGELVQGGVVLAELE